MLLTVPHTVKLVVICKMYFHIIIWMVRVIDSQSRKNVSEINVSVIIHLIKPYLCVIFSFYCSRHISKTSTTKKQITLILVIYVIQCAVNARARGKSDVIGQCM